MTSLLHDPEFTLPPSPQSTLVQLLIIFLFFIFFSSTVVCIKDLTLAGQALLLLELHCQPNYELNLI
jgi:hypothetical protein